MDALPAASQNMKTFGTIMGLVFVFTTCLGLCLGSVLTLFSTGTRKLSHNMQKSMEKFPGAWSKRSSDLKEMNEAWGVLERERGKQVPAVLYFVWFCCVRFFIILPASELRQLGGLTTIFRAGTANPRGGRWIWTLALVPFRVAFLPFDLALVAAAYILLVLFTGWIVGAPNEPRRDPLISASVSHPSPQQQRNSSSGSADGRSVYTMRAGKPPRRKPTIREAFIQRFRQPITILIQFSSYFSSFVTPVAPSTKKRTHSRTTSSHYAGPRLTRKTPFYQAIDESLSAAAEYVSSESEETDYEEDDVEEHAPSVTTTSDMDEVVVVEENSETGKGEGEVNVAGELPPPPRRRMSAWRAYTNPDLERGKQ